MEYDKEEITYLVLKEMDKYFQKAENKIWKIAVTYNDKQLIALEEIFKKVIVNELIANNNIRKISKKEILDQIADIYYNKYYKDVWDIRYDTLIELAQKTLNEITKEKGIENIDIYTIDEGNFVGYLFEIYADYQKLDFQLNETLKRMK